MPKLSQQTLEKRFQCPHCSVTLRTRQGLSGHIQFIHPKGTTNTESKSLIDSRTQEVLLQRLASESRGITEANFREMAEIRADWHFIKASMASENIKLNDTDYKTYLFVAAALMYGNERLMNKLKKELSSAFEQLMEIVSKMGSKS